MSDKTSPSVSIPAKCEPNRLTNISDLAKQYQVVHDRYYADHLLPRIEGLMRTKSWSFTNAVALGLGSFSWTDKSAKLPDHFPDRCDASLYQLVFFLDMIKCAPYNPGMKLYALDHQFNNLDKKLLESKGITMIATKNQGCVDPPLGQVAGDTAKVVGPHTLLFAPGYACKGPLLHASPELFVGQITDQMIEALGWPDDTLRATKGDPANPSEELKQTIEEDRKAAVALEKFRKETISEAIMVEGDPLVLNFGLFVCGLHAYYDKSKAI